MLSFSSLDHNFDVAFRKNQTAKFMFFEKERWRVDLQSVKVRAVQDSLDDTGSLDSWTVWEWCGRLHWEGTQLKSMHWVFVQNIPTHLTSQPSCCAEKSQIGSLREQNVSPTNFSPQQKSTESPELQHVDRLPQQVRQEPGRVSTHTFACHWTNLQP